MMRFLGTCVVVLLMAIGVANICIALYLFARTILAAFRGSI